MWLNDVSSAPASFQRLYRGERGSGRPGMAARRLRRRTGATRSGLSRDAVVLLCVLIVATATMSAARAQPVTLMSPEWAKQACAAWNEQPALSDELGTSGWARNNQDRGYKVLHVYRKDCPDSARVELRIEHQADKASCVYGGPAENQELDTDLDYLMYADSRRWQEMGAGKYGPMRAMMFRRLRFQGPKWEAMRNMGPFEQFLLLVGKVESDVTRCP